MCSTSVAEAADVARLPLTQTIGPLVITPDGAAHMAIDGPGARGSIGHANLDGTFTTERTRSLSLYGTVGPDGRAWFLNGIEIRRSGAAPIDLGQSGEGLATGPDGTAWVPEGNSILRVRPDGTSTSTPLEVPGCDGAALGELQRASDGAMWFAAPCGIVRVPVSGPPAIVAHASAGSMAADAAGGMWFSAPQAISGGHIAADGTLMRLQGLPETYGVAVGPDGAAYFSTGKCHLVRAAPDGKMSRVPTAIPTWQVAFDPGGGMWLASGRHLIRPPRRSGVPVPRGWRPRRPPGRVHDEPAGPACDETGPELRATPTGKLDRTGYGTVSLAKLRRAHGFKVRVGEPAEFEAYVTRGFHQDPFTSVRETVTRARTVRIPISAKRLRTWAKRKRVQLSLTLAGTDAEGNLSRDELVLKVVR